MLGRRRTLLLGLSLLVVAMAVLIPLLTPRGPRTAIRPSTGRNSKFLVKLVSKDVSITVASGSYDMTYTDTTTPPTQCAQAVAGSAGVPTTGCSPGGLSDVSGHGTVDTNPYAMVTVSQVGSLGAITLYDNGTNVWEVGGGNYGLNGPRQAGPGGLLSGFASLVEGTLGKVPGALNVQGLASGTGYLDLETQEIQGAQPAGTGIVDGVPVTIYKVAVTGLQDPDMAGLTAEQIATIQAADSVIEQGGLAGETVWISVDGQGYIREQRTLYTLADGSIVTQDTVLSNFGCAGTVTMPGQTDSSTPSPGCVTPDTLR
jgi:hypothetical protein